eukprot:scaffold170899_cov74-Attheya_sp.AAC.1
MEIALGFLSSGGQLMKISTVTWEEHHKNKSYVVLKQLFRASPAEMGHNKLCEFLAQPLSLLVAQPAHVVDTPAKKKRMGRTPLL